MGDLAPSTLLAILRHVRGRSGHFNNKKRPSSPLQPPSARSGRLPRDAAHVQFCHQTMRALRLRCHPRPAREGLAGALHLPRVPRSPCTARRGRVGQHAGDAPVARRVWRRDRSLSPRCPHGLLALARCGTRAVGATTCGSKAMPVVPRATAPRPYSSQFIAAVPSKSGYFRLIL